MLTVKLARGNTMKIMEAQTIKIVPVGKPKEGNIPAEVTRIVKELGANEVHVLGAECPTCNGPQPCTNAVREIVLTNNGRNESVFVGYEGSESIADPVELWDCAYIENAHGATTERVYGQP